MIEPFTFRSLPGTVLFGAGRIGEAAEVLKGIGAARALILSTPGQRELAARLKEQLGGLAAGIFAGAVMHTPVEVTREALRRFTEVGADSVVSVGGGSTTGLGKAIAFRTDAPQLVIPTTYAGSEMTPIIGETEAGAKRTQRTPKVLPEAVIYDVELTLALPARVSATSGMNAMAHAVEALYANDRNPVTSLMAEEGLRVLAASLPRLVAAPGDRDARSDAQYGGWLCGVCLGTTAMALHHKLCHVLGGAFNLPHAETHAVLLPHAVAYNAAAAPDAMSKVGRALRSPEAAGGLFDLASALGVPQSLREIGMPEAGLDRAVDLALRDPYWNPRPIEADGIRQLLSQAFHGLRPQPAEHQGGARAQFR